MKEKVKVDINNKNCVIYARYSSAGQTEQSIEGQLRVCREYAERQGFKVIDEYIDRATTGTNDNRPAFRDMLDNAKKKEFAYIVVYKLDRFARNKYDSVIHKRNLNNLGVKVLSATEILSDSPEGRLMENILESMAELYSEDLSQKVKRGIKESLIKGNFIGGNVLYGYKVENKKLVVDEEKANIIRFVFGEYAKGRKKKDIMDELNNKGLRLNGKKFTKNSFQNALSNKKYKGEYIINGIESNSYPAIVDKETFEKVQEILSKYKHSGGKHKAGEEYILTGIAYCGHCGAKMVGISGTSKTKEKRHRYYVCANKWKNKSCDKHNEPKEILENTVFEKLLEHLNNPDNLAEFASGVLKEYENNCTTQIVKDYEKRLSRTDTELDKCFDMLLNAESEEIKTRANTKVKELEIQKKDLQAELNKLKTAQSFKNKTLEEVMETMQIAFGVNDFGIERRKRLINELVICVLVYDNETIVIIDESGLNGKLDGKECKEWYEEFDKEFSSELNSNEDICIGNISPRHID